ncbi:MULTISPECIES: DUF4375 domain-containing protein [Bradyrhizobium]|jgi:hypothetical protein|uniref:DMP19 family protein n=1 Tax=Bradyrhizobium TaxID=374 RepID=UPI0004661EEB|nr:MULTISPECIES: DUF4375 domain-containing protein [Bradyrhizobium]KIU44128.1 hypothetical protein QU41_31300 [Bradyrhizobium elkanii]OCX27846.1 hypothetical protein QU42_28310 [Bradyrhizobium sp. UASWS1016]
MAGQEVKFIGGRLTGAMVPKSSLGGESYDAPRAIVEFTNHIRTACQYADHELPPEILGIYCADYYLAQVNNGGHSQFVHNSGQSLSTNIQYALPGLKAIGAEEQYRTLAELNDWIIANPEAATAQDGFSSRAGDLDALDTRFYEAEQHASITDLAARWIANWSKLEIVDGERYGERLKALAAQNPNFEIRRIWRATAQNSFNLTDKLQATVAVACGAVEVEPDIKIRINAGRYIKFEGQAVVEWGVTTDKGLRYAIVHDSGGILRETVQDAASKSRVRTAGRQLASVSAQMVQSFVDASDRNNAAVAIDLVMLRAGYVTTKVGHPALTAWKIEGDSATFIARVGSHNLIVRTAFDGAVLLDAADVRLLAVAKDEIAAHQAQARRGSESMQQA